MDCASPSGEGTELQAENPLGKYRQGLTVALLHVLYVSYPLGQHLYEAVVFSHVLVVVGMVQLHY